MKFWTLTALLCLLPAAAHAEDMQAYRNQTRKLVREGKHAEALERILWFHDNALEHDPGMSGVRLSFALSDWNRLADDYPPAGIALLEVRDRTTKRLLEDGGNFQLFQEAAAINRTLEDDAGTVHLFEQMEKSYPRKAPRYWIVAKDYVIAAKRYDLAGRYMKDLDADYRRVKQMYDLNLKLSNDPKFGADHKNYTERTFTNSVLQLIEVALATDRRQDAESIQKQALAVRDDTKIRNAIPPSDK